MFKVTEEVKVPDGLGDDRVVRWKIRRKQLVNPSVLVCQLVNVSGISHDIRAPGYGSVALVLEEGSEAKSGCVLFNFFPCFHHVVMKDLCAECGANLRKEGGLSGERIASACANIPMVHAIPELHVSEPVANEIALQDQQSLLAARKLVLLVDLDQTIIHTTNSPRAFKYKDVHRYRFPGSPLIYHTRFRPHLQNVLDCLSHLYQMHICTFGNRVYAHQLASMIDPKRRYFSQRILSRDECFNPITKSANLKALFPRGLNLVCIIDDRGEVWNWSANLIHVKPYHFFPDIGDINAFPWSVNDMKPSNHVKINSSESKSNLSDHLGSTNRFPDQSTQYDTNREVMNDANDTQLNDELSENETKYCSDDISSPNESAVIETKSSDESLLSEPDFNNSVDDVAEVADQECDSVILSTSDSVQLTVEERMDLRDENYLLRLQEILINIHRNYFKAYDAWRDSLQIKCELETDKVNISHEPSSIDSSMLDSSSKTRSHQHTDKSVGHLPHVAKIISKLRKSVLGPSCHVTLSGLSPAHFPVDRCLAGRITRSLGAVLHSRLRLPRISLEVEESLRDIANVDKSNEHRPRDILKHGSYTTHLVACRRGTEKARAALKYLNNEKSVKDLNFYLVSPHWLWDCHYHWKHADETQHILEQDFHPCEFDPEVESAPNTMRYFRRIQRHSLRTGLHSTSAQDFRRKHHSSEHKNDSHSYVHPASFDRNSGDFTNSHVRLDQNLVRSALDSIRNERAIDRKRKADLKSRNKHRKKRLCIESCATSKSMEVVSSSPVSTELGTNVNCDADLPNLNKTTNLFDECRNSESPDTSSSSPSINSSDSSGDEDKNDNNNIDNKICDVSQSKFQTFSIQSLSTDLHLPDSLVELGKYNDISTMKFDSSTSESNLNVLESGDTKDSQLEYKNKLADQIIEEIKDDGEEDFEENFSTNSMEFEEDSNDEINEQKEFDEMYMQLKAYLPPPKSLVLVDNPLIHLPPDATGQMLAEIEDAVLEEETEKATSIPREAEVYDPASLNLDDSSGDSSSEPTHISSTSAVDLVHRDKFYCNKRRTQLGRLESKSSSHDHPNDPVTYSQDALRLQVKRELLMRRRYRATSVERVKIDKSLRRLNACIRRENRRHQTLDDLGFDRLRQGTWSTDSSEESESECDTYDADYPKGWSPEERARHRTHRIFSNKKHWYDSRSSRSMSPAIHSDPEPNLDWWRQDGEDNEVKEWNTCPEGYDYVDAENTRKLLFNSRRDRYESTRTSGDAGYAGRGHGNLTRCLFGADEGAEDADEIGGHVSDSSNLNDSDDDEEDYADECWDPLREFL